MPYGKGTYGSKVGKPSKKAKAAGRKKPIKRKTIKKASKRKMPKMKRMKY